tara:strand:- start:895 stop:1140 length:246 start_codon:yes stop_codon:yes gene_type:complete
MNSSEKLLKFVSDFIETSSLASEDLKKELINNLKFKKDNLIEKFDLVSREEFDVLKKTIEKQQKEIQRLIKLKKTKKAKRS